MKRTFHVTMSYELHPTTPPEARKLLRAELVGRKWNDRHKTALMPSSTVWCSRSMGDDDTPGRDLRIEDSAIVGDEKRIGSRSAVNRVGQGQFG